MTNEVKPFEEIRALAWEAYQAQIAFDRANHALGVLNQQFDAANNTYTTYLQSLSNLNNRIEECSKIIPKLTESQEIIRNLKFEHKEELEASNSERAQVRDAFNDILNLIAFYTSSPNRDIVIQSNGLITLTNRIVNAKEKLARGTPDQLHNLDRDLKMALARAFSAALILIKALLDACKTDKDTIEQKPDFIEAKTVVENNKTKENEWNNGLKDKLTNERNTKFTIYQNALVHCLVSNTDLNQQNATQVTDIVYNNLAHAEAPCKNVEAFNASFGRDLLEIYFPDSYPQQNNANSPAPDNSSLSNKKPEGQSNNSHFHKQEPASSNNESPERGKLRTVLNMLQQHTYILHHGGETIREKTYSKTAGLYVKKIKAFLKPIETEKDIDDAS
ncbi:MAG: hypothetical protein WC785_06085, partial [Tatlockia sp.]